MGLALGSGLRDAGLREAGSSRDDRGSETVVFATSAGALGGAIVDTSGSCGTTGGGTSGSGCIACWIAARTARVTVEVEEVRDTTDAPSLCASEDALMTNEADDGRRGAYVATDPVSEPYDPEDFDDKLALELARADSFDFGFWVALLALVTVFLSATNACRPDNGTERGTGAGDGDGDGAFCTSAN